MKIQTHGRRHLVLAFLLSLMAVASVRAGSAPAFPDTLYFNDGESDHRLELTGDDERVFLFFDVYEIAHYAEAAAVDVVSQDTVVSDGPVKALAIHFSMSLSHSQVRREFEKSMRRNAAAGWLEEAAPTIEAFTNAIDRGAEAGDRLVFYWLPGGRVFVEFNGERAFAATDTVFAKLVWSIWFGDDPVCDADELLAGVPGGMGQ